MSINMDQQLCSKENTFAKGKWWTNINFSYSQGIVSPILGIQ